MNNDQINSLFELIGSVFLILNIKRIKKDKQVRGVSYVPIAFYTLWGLWNLYYYPSLEQWYSVSAGALLTTINVWWLSLYYKYRNN